MSAAPERVLAHLERELAGCDEPLCGYVYDLQALADHAAAVVGALPAGCEMFYAIKANPDLPLLATLASRVAGFEVSSGGELQWVREHFPAAPVAFSGPGKTDAELALALRAGVDAVHVESFGELRRLAAATERLQREAPVLLRANPSLPQAIDTPLVMGGQPSPFGMPADELDACARWLREQPRLRLRGLHFHLASHQLDAAAHAALLDACVRLALHWGARHGVRLEQVNLGGGIGVNYRDPARQFDWGGFVGALAATAARAAAAGIRLRFECGRYLAAGCGYYAAEVLDVKRSHGRPYAVVRGGTHHFRTPAAQGHSHPFGVLGTNRWPHAFERPAVRDEPVWIVGQLCTPKDLLAAAAPVARLRAGDVVVFALAGAYAWHISPHAFLRHAPPRFWYLPAAPALTGAAVRPPQPGSTGSTSARTTP